MAIIPDKVAQFVADVDTAHKIIHGPASGAGSMVDTDGGPVRTLARAVAEGGATAAELAALRAAVDSLSTANLSDWEAATADFLTAADVPAAPVTSVAGRTGDVVLQTADLSDWEAATADFLTAADVPVAPVTSVAGRTGDVVLQTTDLSDWEAATAGFGGGSGGSTTFVNADTPAAAPTIWDDDFQIVGELDTAGTRRAGALPWTVNRQVTVVGGGAYSDPALSALDAVMSLAATGAGTWAAKIWESFSLFALDADGWALEFNVVMTDGELYPRVQWFTRNPSWSTQSSGWIVFYTAAAGSWVRGPIYMGIRFTGSALELLYSYSGLRGTYKVLASRPFATISRVGLVLPVGSGVMWFRRLE